MAVAMSADICITGCEGGRVKVWDLKTGQLIKVRFICSVHCYDRCNDLLGHVDGRIVNLPRLHWFEMLMHNLDLSLNLIHKGHV